METIAILERDRQTDLREHILACYDTVVNGMSDPQGVVLMQWQHNDYEGAEVPFNEMLNFTRLMDAVPRDLFYAADVIIEELADDVPPVTRVRLVSRLQVAA